MKFRDTWYTIPSPSSGSAGPRFSVSSDGWRATLNVQIAGKPSLIARAIKDFLGYSSVGVQGGTRYIKRVLPHSLPFFLKPGPNPKRILWCTGVSIDEQHTQIGREEVGGEWLPWYRWCSATLTYSALRYPLLEDNDPAVIGQGGVPDESLLTRYVFPIPKPTLRTITAPQGSFSFQAKDVYESPITAAFGVPINEPGADVTLRWLDVPEVPNGSLARCMGTINSAAFAGYAAETLVCMPPDITPTIQANGTTAYTIDLKFNFNPKVSRFLANGNDDGVTQNGHNFFLRRVHRRNAGANPVPGGERHELDYRQVGAKNDGTGARPYRTTDFRNLLRLDP